MPGTGNANRSNSFDSLKEKFEKGNSEETPSSAQPAKEPGKLNISQYQKDLQKNSSQTARKEPISLGGKGNPKTLKERKNDLLSGDNAKGFFANEKAQQNGGKGAPSTGQAEESSNQTAKEAPKKIDNARLNVAEGLFGGVLKKGKSSATNGTQGNQQAVTPPPTASKGSEPAAEQTSPRPSSSINSKGQPAPPIPKRPSQFAALSVSSSKSADTSGAVASTSSIAKSEGLNGESKNTIAAASSTPATSESSTNEQQLKNVVKKVEGNMGMGYGNVKEFIESRSAIKRKNCRLAN